MVVNVTRSFVADGTLPMPRLAFLIFAVALAGCARDDEAALRDRLSGWFFLDARVYFKSKMRCTAAVYTIEEPGLRPALTVQNDPDRAKAALTRHGHAAIRMEGYSPHDLTDALLLSGAGAFGKEALGAAAQAVPCFEGTSAETQLLRALTRRGATMVYDRESEGLMILDPDAQRLFYVAGDVW